MGDMNLLTDTSVNIKNQFLNMSRMSALKKVVHFDLKGAPLKIPYFEKVLHCIKTWGATGILLEWEDTFPYHSEIIDIGSTRGYGGDGLYSRDEVYHIFEYAKMLNLEVIQLIQTFGHMEFVLKHPNLASLRENPQNPSSLCPSRPQSLELVRRMVDQVLEAQPDAKYLHIGADEVWSIGECENCRERSATMSTSHLYLDHIRNLGLYIQLKKPDLTVLFWDDMIRPLPVEILKPYNLGKLMVPVLWYYNDLNTFFIGEEIYKKYKELFPSMWAASAYKGADGSSRMNINPKRYYENHLGWMREFRNHPDMNIAGIILTGWSRFDHYATLCELLPTALSCLMTCLKILNKTQDEVKVEDIAEPQLSMHDWPGYELAFSVDQAGRARTKYIHLVHGDKCMSWVNEWQLENNFTHPLRVRSIGDEAVEVLNELTNIKGIIQPQLLNFTGPRSTEEWLHTFITPAIKHVAEVAQTARRVGKCEPGLAPGFKYPTN